MIDTVLAQLDQVKRNGTGWSAKCPGHNDNRASLSISVGGDERILVKCHAGCEFRAIVEAAGLRTADFFPSNGDTDGYAPHKQIVATYDYVDEHGAILLQVCRMQPKDFRQRRPDGRGGWIWGTRGIRRVLYRLPELLKAPTESWRFVVEGEKDADRLADLGCVATTSPGGVKKWKASYSKSLGGRRVAILPDNDEPGRKHADEVAQSLHGTAAKVRIVELPGLPEKGDVSDWLDQGHTSDELLALVEAAPPYVPPATHTDSPSPAPVDRSIHNHEWSTVVADNGKEKKVPVAVPLDRIIEMANRLTGGWPRECGGSLFVVSEDRQVNWLEKHAELFGFLHHAAAPDGVKWMVGPGFVTKGEYHAEVVRRAKRYEAVELYPHIPPMPNTFYVPRTTATAAAGHDALRKLVDRFCPETPADREFIGMAFITPAWGGPPGQRPGFAIDSSAGDCGRGVGKTSLAMLIGYLYGGHFLIGDSEDREKLLKRILTPTARTKRIAIIDNAKGTLSSADIESLITSHTLSGYANYVGEAERPNTLCWFITANGVELSKDLAQRVIVIRLAQPAYQPDWERQTVELIDQQRDAIFADIARILTVERPVLDRFSRWGAWEAAVLATGWKPDELQTVIEERQNVADTDKDLFEAIVDFFAHKLREAGYDISASTHIRIPSGVAGQWYLDATGERVKPMTAARRLKAACGSHYQIQPDPSRTYGRCFLFSGSPEVMTGVPVHFDPDPRRVCQ